MEEVTIQECSICHQDIDKQILSRINPSTGVEIRDVYWTEGHNAEPVTDGRCCTSCNNDVVVPERIRRLQVENAYDA